MKRLYRNTKDGKIAGVCSGLGDYFELDPVVFRLLMLLSFFIAGPFFYIIAWIVMPREN
jgi:phage shock protein PspC (stress-responsive transcriptional regulator)